MKNFHKKNKAFTLVELLVTTAIIGTLVSFTLPVVSSAREKVRRVVCSSNLKQWGITLNNYSLSYNDSLPPHAPDWGYTGVLGYKKDGSWQMSEEMVKNFGIVRDVWFCPSEIPCRTGIHGTTNGPFDYYWNPNTPGHNFGRASSYNFFVGDYYWVSPSGDRANFFVAGDKDVKSFRSALPSEVMMNDRYLEFESWADTNGALFGTCHNANKPDGVNVLKTDGSSEWRGKDEVILRYSAPYDGHFWNLSW